MHWNHPAAEVYFGWQGYFLAWLILILGVSVFVFTMFRRYRLIRLGKPDPRFSDSGKRAAALFKDGFIQRRQPRYLLAGVLHITFFWGFVVLGLHSIELVVAGIWPGYVFPFMAGVFGALYNSIKDIASLVVLVASIVAIFRRAVLKPERYQDSHQFEAYFVLGLIAFLMVTDMFYEGSQLLSTNARHGIHPSALFFKMMMAGAGSDFLRTINHLSYWLHIFCLFLFLNLLPLSKHFHIITALPNVFFKNLNQGALKPPRWDLVEIEQLDSAGVRTYSDFTWKHILDFCSCTECGRCTDNCPANAVGKPLSPKKFTMDLRDFGYHNHTLFGNERLGKKAIPKDVIHDEAFWSCTTCGACEQECPVFIEYIDKMVEFRRQRVMMESNFPLEIEQVYRHLEVYGNSYGMGPTLRNDWAAGQSIKTIDTDSTIDILFWVGCAGAFDSRSQQVAHSFVKILNKAGVNFGTLGQKETCCGDYARRTGNEYLFHLLARKNIEILNNYNIKKIVTICPHGFNTLKNEYPRLGGNYDVVHATEFIFELIETGKLELSQKPAKTVTYHDPCYLGRHNGRYDIPRKLLSEAVGLEIIEPEKSRDKSFCCGAGGGHYWMESTGQRINDVRTGQLLEKNAEIIATSCPYCLIMLDDGLESKEMKGKVAVQDIIELVAESC